MHFRALEGDAIRISGTPGGSARFISVGELRAFSLTPATEPEPLPANLAIDRIYPNPFNATTSVRLKTVAPGLHYIEVYDLLGRLMLRSSAFSHGEETLEVPINLSGLAGGSYLVRAVGPDSAITRTHRISLLR